MTEAIITDPPDTRPEVAPARMAVRDLLSEAVAGIFARPGRTLLTVLGTVLRIGALVATLGVAKTAGNHIVGRFDELSAPSVVVTNEQGFFGGGGPRARIPPDAEERLMRLNGVNAAGAMGTVDVGGALVRSVPIPDPLAQTEFQMSIYAATPGLLHAVRGTLRTGRWSDLGPSERDVRTAILVPG